MPIRVEISNGCVANEGFPRFGKVILFVENGKVDNSNLPDFLDENVSVFGDSSVKGYESGLVKISDGSEVQITVDSGKERSSFEIEGKKHYLPDISLRGVIDEIRVTKGYSTNIYFREKHKSIDVSVLDKEEYEEKALGISPPLY
jgi:hypothetical protein